MTFSGEKKNMLVILSKRITCDSECQYPQGDWQPHTLLKHCVHSHCRVEGVEVHVKLMIPRMTTFADFKKRWRQRGKNCGLQL